MYAYTQSGDSSQLFPQYTINIKLIEFLEKKCDGGASYTKFLQNIAFSKICVSIYYSKIFKMQRYFLQCFTESDHLKV